ncbi:MAG: hypothetical protein EXS55_00115 [Candidatus Magasanikbacteria bacterium]|nr:hypothetical protein [Candidatus Magasanikbacteria bacterium]
MAAKKLKARTRAVVWRRRHRALSTSATIAERLWAYVKIRTFGLVTTTVFFGIALTMVIFSISQAQEIVFFPTTCLGSVQNPQHAAQNILDTTEPRDLFSTTTAAVFTEGVQQLYCGDFRGVAEEQILVSRLRLHLAWSLVSEESLVSTVNEITPSAATTTTEEPATLELSMALDEETIPETNSTTGSVFELPLVVTSTSDNVSSTAEASTALLVPESLPGMFLIQYSLDGVAWQSLATVNIDHPESDFEIPITEPIDPGRVQIMLQFVPGAMPEPPVYVDGMMLIAAPTDSVPEAVEPLLKAEEISIVVVSPGITTALAHTPDGYSLWYAPADELGNTTAPAYKIETSELLPLPPMVKDNTIFWLSGRAEPEVIAAWRADGEYNSQTIIIDSEPTDWIGSGSYKVHWRGGQWIIFNGDTEEYELPDSQVVAALNATTTVAALVALPLVAVPTIVVSSSPDTTILSVMATSTSDMFTTTTSEIMASSSPIITVVTTTLSP